MWIVASNPITGKIIIYDIAKAKRNEHNIGLELVSFFVPLLMGKKIPFYLRVNF